MDKSASELHSRSDYDQSAQYTRLAIVLHWLIAALLAGQIAFGWFLDSVPRGSPLRGFYVNLHKSTGLTLALLILVRVVWRLLNSPPPLPAFMPAWERRAAQWSHVALYVCMLGMPLSGYIASNFSKYGVKLFNVLLLPPWGTQDQRLYAIFNTTHVVLSYCFVTLIVLHIVAAISHAVRGDGVISRILVARRPRGNRVRV
jgi:cytochrome b561